MSKKLPKIALGAWAWGNDGTFGPKFTSENLKPIFDCAMEKGLNYGILLSPMEWEPQKKY